MEHITKQGRFRIEWLFLLAVILVVSCAHSVKQTREEKDKPDESLPIIKEKENLEFALAGGMIVSEAVADSSNSTIVSSRADTLRVVCKKKATRRDSLYRKMLTKAKKIQRPPRKKISSALQLASANDIVFNPYSNLAEIPAVRQKPVEEASPSAKPVSRKAVTRTQKTGKISKPQPVEKKSGFRPQKADTVKSVPASAKPELLTTSGPVKVRSPVRVAETIKPPITDNKTAEPQVQKSYLPMADASKPVAETASPPAKLPASKSEKPVQEKKSTVRQVKGKPAAYKQIMDALRTGNESLTITVGSGKKYWISSMARELFRIGSRGYFRTLDWIVENNPQYSTRKDLDVVNRGDKIRLPARSTITGLMLASRSN